MTDEDLKTVAYYAHTSYTTHGRNDMSIDQYFQVRDYVKINKNATRLMEKLREQNKS